MDAEEDDDVTDGGVGVPDGVLGVATGDTEGVAADVITGTPEDVGDAGGGVAAPVSTTRGEGTRRRGTWCAWKGTTSSSERVAWEGKDADAAGGGAQNGKPDSSNVT